jgi:hypothetical protein
MVFQTKEEAAITFNDRFYTAGRKKSFSNRFFSPRYSLVFWWLTFKKSSHFIKKIANFGFRIHFWKKKTVMFSEKCLKYMFSGKYCVFLWQTDTLRLGNRKKTIGKEIILKKTNKNCFFSFLGFLVHQSAF